MRKLIGFILVCGLLLSAAACGGDTTASSSPESSNPESSSPESSFSESTKPVASVVTSGEEVSSEETTAEDGNLVINYTSVADGYIDHHLTYDFGIVNFPSFQCMDREVLLLPKGTVIMCENSFAIYCYDTDRYYKEDQLLYNTFLCEKIGQSISPTKDVVLSSGTFVLQQDSIVRFSVKGKLSDVKIYPSKGDEEKVRLMTEIDCINECFKK